jgi:uncharacterized secreted protein with C-terminal beta-propeller domain
MTEPSVHFVKLARLLGVGLDEPTLKLCLKLLDEDASPQELSHSIARILSEVNTLR